MHKSKDYLLQNEELKKIIDLNRDYYNNFRLYNREYFIKDGKFFSKLKDDEKVINEKHYKNAFKKFLLELDRDFYVIKNYKIIKQYPEIEYPKNKYIVLDLFCGAGGFSLGFHLAGFYIIGGIDNDYWACKTFKLNFNKNFQNYCLVINENIEKMDLKKLPFKKRKIDIIIGSPPCQGFSLIGRAKKNALFREYIKINHKKFIKNNDYEIFEDPRNLLYKIFVKFVDYYKPKFFVMENVPGLFSIKNGTLKDQIIKDFTKIGYNTNNKLLNSAEYGLENINISVPQIRKRVFFIGNRIEISSEKRREELIKKIKKLIIKKVETKNIIYLKNIFPEKKFQIPILRGGKNYVQLNFEKYKLLKMPRSTNVKEAISDLVDITPNDKNEIINYSTPPQSKYQKWARNKSDKLYNHSIRKVTERDKEVFKYMREKNITKYKDLPDKFKFYGAGDKFSDKFKRINYNRPCHTILAHLEKDGYYYIHPKCDRTISVREAARLQSFPDHFIFCGPKSEQYKQIGNAVPPLLAYAIAKEIKKVLDMLELNR
ncbi:MAG: DNA cytosine methyltransferase [Candidatus Helarchaeota archaeon]